jgi:hypothetical protein
LADQLAEGAVTETGDLDDAGVFPGEQVKFTLEEIAELGFAAFVIAVGVTGRAGSRLPAGS